MTRLCCCLLSETKKAPGSPRALRERVTGFEPATSCLASTRSSQLSYTRTQRGECTIVRRSVNGAFPPFTFSPPPYAQIRLYDL